MTMLNDSSEQMTNEPGGSLGDCALCGEKNVILKESHSIPKFAYDWVKKTSPTKYIRYSLDVNVRRQDGPKEYLLCGGCEGRLSIVEKALAENVFRKVANYRKQSSKITITEDVRLAVLSIFWRALLTTKDDEGEWTNEDIVKVDEFLEQSRQSILNNRCEVTIYFAPLYGEPPFFGLPKKYTYNLDRAIGEQDIKFTDDPHRYIAAFKLPFMYFYILSEGWPRDEYSKALKLDVGELDISNISDVPDILREYIELQHYYFLQTKAELDETNKRQISRDAGKPRSVLTGADKSLLRSDQ